MDIHPSALFQSGAEIAEQKCHELNRLTMLPVCSQIGRLEPLER